MSSARAGSLFCQLAQVPDPRGRKGRRHSLSAMLTAIVCGLLCGARGYEGLVEWLHDQPVDIWHWMGFLRRPPKKDCFRDLLMKLDPTHLDAALRAWVSQDLQLSDETESIAGVSFDGKSLCATLRSYSRVVHLLSAVDHQTGCVLSQMRVDEKTNEHKTALELLKNLVMSGRVLVGDAMFCQRDLCQQIVDSGGDYLVAVKENQANLLREIQHEFAASDSAFSPLPTAATRL
jgi:DDE_Tnp_1-associated/Transposase DDE domain